MSPVYDMTSSNTTVDIDNRTSYKEHDAGGQDHYIYDQSVLQKISVTLYSIIFVLGIIGNGLVIWIAGFRMKKTISAVWFLHLAIADFLCCSSLPLLIALNLHILPDTPNVNLFCILIIILFTTNMCTSIYLLTAMSIDRCVSVMWPFWAKVHRTRRLVRITAGVIWGLSLLGAGLVGYSNRWCLISRNEDEDRHKQQLKHNIQLVGLVIMFVIPFLIILTSYVIIFLKLRESKRPQRSQRPYRIITAVILGFFLCWFPIYIWPLTPSSNLRNSQRITIDIIVTNLAYLNSCINPIIYVFMGQNFRSNFLRSIPARVQGALNEEPEDLRREPENVELQ
ncbi:C3a anaphylatoxin chemotactic receptor-like [Leptodactylus fuscus]|uniref:C3a anaphylatoxin chemotactic receptor-like n=1 Tax=Leptodactylus fuscus TaxID=238119 RepID=UPI003F4E9CF8